MTQYSGRDRIRAAHEGTFTDRIPVTFLAAALYGTRFTHYTSEEMQTDAKKNAECIIKTWEEFRPDMIIISAAGGPEGSTGPSQQRFEDKVTLAQMRPPDPEKKSAVVTYRIEVTNRVRSAIKDIPVMSGFPGPWSTAVAMRGAEKLIYDTMDDPEWVHSLLRFTTALVKRALKALREEGIETWLMEPSASCSLMSPKIYREFAMPYDKEIVDYLKATGVEVGLHQCGYNDPILQDIVSIGFDAISIDGPTSLKKALEAARERAVIIGNVPTELFSQGSKDEIEAAVRECVEIGTATARYVLASGCEIPYTASPDNIRYFVEAAKKYGRY